MKKNTIMLKAMYKPQVADFLRLAIFREFTQFRDTINEFNSYDDEDSAYFMKTMYHLLNLLHRIDSTGNPEDIIPIEFDAEDIEVSLDEAICYRDLIDMTLCDIIRENDEIDNVKWLVAILSFYTTCDEQIEKDRTEKLEILNAE